MDGMNPKVDRFLGEAKKWQEEMTELRRILLDCQLNEELKWRQPCYTAQGKNIVLIGGFKEYCALLFVKGVLLKDAKRVLVRPGEHTHAARMNSLHQRSRNHEDETHFESVHSRSHRHGKSWVES